jgi:putative protein-disulfide isomerase
MLSDLKTGDMGLWALANPCRRPELAGELAAFVPSVPSFPTTRLCHDALTNPEHSPRKSCPMTTLIYIADPMCAWSYGFGPELSTLLQGLPEARFEIVMGGLRPYSRDSLSAEFKQSLLEEWQQIAAATGLPFSYEILDDGNFVYNTEPACRAVVTARRLMPQGAVNVFYALQHAFYAEGQNITRGEVLARIASTTLTQLGLPITPEGFYQIWCEAASIEATLDDFTRSQGWGVTGFPTLVMTLREHLQLVTAGYVRTEVLVDRMQAIRKHLTSTVIDFSSRIPRPSLC